MKAVRRHLLIAAVALVVAAWPDVSAYSQARSRQKSRAPAQRNVRRVEDAGETGPASQIKLPAIIRTDGSAIEAEEIWEMGESVWFKRGGVAEQIARSLVREIKRPPSEITRPAETSTEATATGLRRARTYTIFLAGGARFEVDDVTERADGYWYQAGNISTLLDRSRVERVARTEELEPAAAPDALRRWTTANRSLDSIIAANGERYAVDPYLIFLVMEQESHFNRWAVSPRGARGLMQLMPGTARRFGVTRPFDPQQSVRGGTRYLRELLSRYGGRVDLVLAGYNAGEGAVARYGQRVPPFRETRNYVKKISARYRSATHPGEQSAPGSR